MKQAQQKQDESIRSFPQGFIWGTASSSHQVEGDNTNSDWWAWEQAGKIRGGHVSGTAAGWWQGRAEEDLALARSLGQDAHRLSLEWSRLEPRPGEFDDAAFQRYADLLGHMQDIGLKPFVTANHFTLPQWAAKRGSWTDPELPAAFARYCTEVARRLGDRVHAWMTLNEPTVLVLMSYLAHKWPPGTASFGPGTKAFLHLMQAHAAGYQAIKAVRPDAQVGLVHNFPLFEAHRTANPLDRAVTWVREMAWNGRDPGHAEPRQGGLPLLAHRPEGARAPGQPRLLRGQLLRALRGEVRPQLAPGDGAPRAAAHHRAGRGVRLGSAGAAGTGAGPGARPRGARRSPST